MTTYFGFGLADGMFPSECSITRRPLTDSECMSELANGVVSCLNPSHKATVAAMEKRGFYVHVPDKAPIVALKPGDRLIVFGVSGLPRLQDRHEYTDDEIRAARFRVGLYEVS